MPIGWTPLEGFEHVVVLEGVNPSLSNPDGKGQPVPVAKATACGCGVSSWNSSKGIRWPTG